MNNLLIVILAGLVLLMVGSWAVGFLFKLAYFFSYVMRTLMPVIIVVLTVLLVGLLIKRG